MNKKKVFIFIFMLKFNCIFAISNLEMLNKIRINLPLLNDSPIGAITSEGKYSIDSGNGLNCVGFAKWIVDGFYYPLSKNDIDKYISIETLRQKHINDRGTKDILIYEEKRDPYFGLDWTRNLAVEIGKKRGDQPNYKTYDVTNSTIHKYVMNCGYPLSKIEKILMEQAKLHPERIYLGSINGNFGKNPTLWQHYHVAVFIPYVENGIIKIAVLERNKETSFSYLLKRYPNTFCHIVSISNDGDFELTIPNNISKK